MEIRLLGSVDVQLDGFPVKLAGPKQRAVLAMLALNANEAVTLDRLIDGLWGEEPPASAPKMVQQYISQLRRLLSDAGGPQIVTRGRGYALEVDRDAVDALRFEALVDGGGGEPAREALALWGPPLAGMLDEPFAASEARRLEELHVAAIEQALQADLEAGRHAEVVGRLAALVDEHPLRERLRALLMLALYRSGRQAEALAVFRDARWTLVETLGIEPGPELRRLQEAILRQDPALELVVPDEAWANRETVEHVGAGAGQASQRRAELRAIEDELAANVVDLHTLQTRAARRGPRPAAGTAACPFKGLEAFDVADAELFFGRERLVAEIVARLPGTSLLGVVGPSGSGKSSAVRAGLLPALARDVLPRSAQWRQVLFRPGERPMAALRGALDVPADADDPVAAALRRVGRGTRLLVVVDQFEELFTACRDPAQRGAFVDALTASDERMVVVLAVRADFYGACAQHPQLARLLGENHVLVGPMRPDELARAIAGPAEQTGLEVEPELISRLVEETAGQTGGLPLLSTTLLELWQRRSGERLSVGAYERTGGVRGAVARLAERAYGCLSPSEAAIGRNILVRLAGEGEVEAVVRRRVRLSELDLDRGAARRVLDVLTENRLLTVGGETVEVAHEALLREWPRLRGWLEHDAEARRLHRHITTAAVEWEAGGRDAGELYRGARLASALDFGAEHGDALNELERAFLDEARMVSEREAERSRRANRRLRLLLAGALAGLVAAGAAGLVALDQRGDARDAATVADAQRLGTQALTDDRLDRALLLARTSVELDDSVATRGNLLSTLERMQPGSLGVLPAVRDVEIYAVAVDPSGEHLAFGDAFGEVQVVDLASRRRLAAHRIASGLVQRLAYSPDGATLAVTSLDTSTTPLDVVLELLDARTLRPRRRIALPRLPHPTEFVGASPVFTGDGDLAVLEIPFPHNQPEAVRRIDGRTGAVSERAFRLRSTVLDPILTNDRRHVLVASDREDATYELDAADLRVVRRHPAGGTALALAPDDRTLALGGPDGTVRILDTGSSRVRRLEGRHTARVTRLAFTPDGRTLTSAAEDGKLIVWDVAEGRMRERLDAHAGTVEALAVTSDGRTAISAGIDGRVALWDLDGSRRLRRAVLLRGRFAVDGFTPRGAAVSPDGRTLAVTESDGGVDLVDTATLGRRAVLRTRDDPALAVDFSPDGRLLAVTGANGTAGLWDARTQAPAGRLAGLRDWVQAVAFSPDGRLVAAGDVNGKQPRLFIWDVRSRALTPFRSGLGAHALAFSPDGRLLAGAGGSEGVEVRDVRSSRVVARIGGGGEFARSVAFSPDGRLLFVGFFDGAGQFFSTRDWKPVAARIRAQGQRILYPRFTPDGRTLVTSSADGTVLLWDVSARKPIGSPLTIEAEAYVAAAMSRDGRHLYALPTSRNGVRLAISPQDWKRDACAIAGREISRQEWADALPGREYRAVCRP
jgi:WD40 repeat protein/DNA-binding SARP family transcriptional activator